MNPLTIAYVETSLPAASQAERFAAIQRWGIALEIANQGDLQIEAYQRAQIPIAAVQAYQMHEFHPLHPDPDHRCRAILHVEETLELAARLNSPRIVTVYGFGHELVDNPFERSVEFFAALADQAKDLGIHILIEPLSPKRVGAMTHPDEIVQLLKTLNQPEVFSILLDTGHLLDSGVDLTPFFSTWQHPIEELQLKGINSAPPNLAMPIAQWLAALSVQPQVICVEHRQPITGAACKQLVAGLKAL
ncbi:MAG TPA: TIM barrel protein [Allocoleopsis sp.]